MLYHINPLCRFSADSYLPENALLSLIQPLMWSRQFERDDLLDTLMKSLISIDSKDNNLLQLVSI